MASHIHFDYMCGNCNEAYLPLEESMRMCPKCQTQANVKHPSIAEIVEAAGENLAWEIFMPMSVADRYVVKAMNIMAVMRMNPRPQNELDLNLTSLLLISGSNFNGAGYLRQHALAFTRAVLKEMCRRQR